MARKNKDQDRDRPSAPAPVSSPKESAKPVISVSAPVSYTGDPMQRKLLWVGLILIAVGYVSMRLGGSKSPTVSHPRVCESGTLVKLTEDHLEEGISIPQNCMSGLIFPMLKEGWTVFVDGPGAVNICLWNNGKCAGIVQTNNKDAQMKYREEIPSFVAIRVWGDPGPAKAYMVKTPRR